MLPRGRLRPEPGEPADCLVAQGRSCDVPSIVAHGVLALVRHPGERVSRIEVQVDQLDVGAALKQHEPVVGIGAQLRGKRRGIGTDEAIERAKAQAAGLDLFLRSLFGLDRAAAKEAFADFMAGRSLTGNQIEFLNLVVNHVTEAGLMEANAP